MQLGNSLRYSNKYHSLSFDGSYSGPALSVLEYDYIHDLLQKHFDFFHHFVAAVSYA